MDVRAQLAEKFGDVTMFRTCEQCGCCSSACPITGLKGFNVRRIVRHVELDLAKEISETPFPWYCTACGRCETVCPNGIAILDIMRPLRAMAPQEFVPDTEAPCMAECPAGIDVPGYLRLIAEGKPREACLLILEKVPFPGVLGRVCTHPCETKCRRGEVNQPISICALKRYAADKAGAFSRGDFNIGKDTGLRVAVVGSGPAGLTAAFYLRKKGHQVTVFEEREKPGGMMRYGIPAYRLPVDVLEREISQILDLGIELKTNVRLGKDLGLDDLKTFNAVFLAMGLPLSRRIKIEGQELPGVMWGLDFLRSVREGKNIELNSRVLVVGGGNVAVDVALTAVRLGAGDVTMACLERFDEMPANPWEIEMAREEGVKIMPSWGPGRILGENGMVSGVELIRCASVFDERGNFCPAFGDETITFPADQVILAIGQAADLTPLTGKDGVRVERNLIIVDPETQETNLKGVFAGGDGAGGPGILVGAIAAGRRAAGSIDRYLGGDGRVDDPCAERDSSGYDGKRDKGFADLTRTSVPHLSVNERIRGFSEVELCLAEDDAVREAKRCLQCDMERSLALRLRQT
ncbi:MAG: 4Fe-4S dicluster domain-containing protein [Desulfobacteraceae bacterium]|jgi:NADPH-dependent glutamate synthase beta subunit-like oxidoreductase|nr:MAG: 4Fe-4S dicluster domain-containing protein [Desulfobacteraceae bacterium]